MQKGFVQLIFILIVGILSVGIIGGAIYLRLEQPKKEQNKNANIKIDSPQILQSVKPSLTPDSDGKNDWKSYEDEKFEVKYPPGWTASKITGSYEGDGGVAFRKSGIAEDDYRNLGYELEIFYRKGDNPELVLDMEEYVERFSDRENFKKDEVIVDGMKVSRVYGVGIDNFRINTIFVKGNYQYSILLIYFTEGEYSLEKAEKAYPESMGIYNRMLSTFKFL